MRFLIDAQLPVGLARILQHKGHESQHVTDLQMMESSDHEIWQWAKDNDAIIVSKDEDFVFLYSKDSEPASLIWIRVGNTRKKQLIEWYESLLPAI